MQYDRLLALGWLTAGRRSRAIDVTPSGGKGFSALGIDLDRTRALRRQFAVACLDWSERRPHLGGALGAAVLHVARRRRWVVADLDSRILRVTTAGRRDLRARFGLDPDLSRSHDVTTGR